MAKSLLEQMVMKNVIKDSCDDDSKEVFQDESEGRKPNRINYDYMSKHILLPLKNSLTSKSMIDIPADTDSTAKPVKPVNPVQQLLDTWARNTLENYLVKD